MDDKVFKIAQKEYDNQCPEPDNSLIDFYYEQAEETLELVKTWIQDNFDRLASSIERKNRLDNVRKKYFIEDRLIECISIKATIGARLFLSNSHKSQAKQEVMETLLRLECDETIIDFLVEHFEKYHDANKGFDSDIFSKCIIELIESEFKLTKEN